MKAALLACLVMIAGCGTRTGADDAEELGSDLSKKRSYSLRIPVWSTSRSAVHGSDSCGVHEDISIAVVETTSGPEYELKDAFRNMTGWRDTGTSDQAMPPTRRIAGTVDGDGNVTFRFDDDLYDEAGDVLGHVSLGVVLDGSSRAPTVVAFSRGVVLGNSAGTTYQEWNTWLPDGCNDDPPYHRCNCGVVSVR